uniref:Uncharacterized protein n=1 Tax=Anguilla anguilla TaxID=7936 RepID=A0A0E9QRW9_ANGAN
MIDECNHTEYEEIEKHRLGVYNNSFSMVKSTVKWNVLLTHERLICRFGPLHNNQPGQEENDR